MSTMSDTVYVAVYQPRSDSSRVVAGVFACRRDAVAALEALDDEPLTLDSDGRASRADGDEVGDVFETRVGSRMIKH